LITLPVLDSIATFLSLWICASHKSITEKGHFFIPIPYFENALLLVLQQVKDVG
jgi:hypothetical protein